MSDKIHNKREIIKRSIKHIQERQVEITNSGIPKEDMQEPRKTEISLYNHFESIRVNLETQNAILGEIEKTDKVTRRALNVAWISLGASIVSLSATIVLYVINTLQNT